MCLRDSFLLNIHDIQCKQQWFQADGFKGSVALSLIFYISLDCKMQKICLVTCEIRHFERSHLHCKFVMCLSVPGIYFWSPQAQLGLRYPSFQLKTYQSSRQTDQLMMTPAMCQCQFLHNPYNCFLSPFYISKICQKHFYCCCSCQHFTFDFKLHYRFISDFHGSQNLLSSPYT